MENKRCIPAPYVSDEIFVVSPTDTVGLVFFRNG